MRKKAINCILKLKYPNLIYGVLTGEEISSAAIYFHFSLCGEGVGARLFLPHLGTLVRNQHMARNAIKLAFM